MQVGASCCISVLKMDALVSQMEVSDASPWEIRVAFEGFFCSWKHMMSFTWLTDSDSASVGGSHPKNYVVGVSQLVANLLFLPSICWLTTTRCCIPPCVYLSGYIHIIHEIHMILHMLFHLQPSISDFSFNTCLPRGSFFGI